VKKLRVGVIYGGRSGEHEVSLASAAAVFKNLDPDRYDAIPILIEKDGRWALPRRPPTLISAADVIEAAKSDESVGRLPEDAPREAHLVAHPGAETLMTIERRNENPIVSGLALDVVFPVLHGPYGEDGTVQGLLELANIPYVGAGVLASAVGMDKAVMKLVFAAKGLPICDYEVVMKREWQRDERGILQRVVNRLGFPVFVKPANLGSSVGISKAKHVAELRKAISLAAEFDRKVVIEAAVPQAREIEVAVLGNDAPEASVPGEIIPSKEFYDYEAKYLDGASRDVIPADLPPELSDRIRALAVAAFIAVDGAGMARVDFLLDGHSGSLFLNEVNTIPGFTTISMYSKMWAASGLAYPALIDRLIALAIERHADKQQLRTSM
jgi:D-alanine-D-alanine ligase